MTYPHHMYLGLLTDRTSFFRVLTELISYASLVDDRLVGDPARFFLHDSATNAVTVESYVHVIVSSPMNFFVLRYSAKVQLLRSGGALHHLCKCRAIFGAVGLSYIITYGE